LVGVRLALIWVVGLEVFSPVLLLLLVVCCGHWMFVCVSSVFSLFLVFCDLVLVKLCLAASKIICKLLMKYVLRYGREKKTKSID